MWKDYENVEDQLWNSESHVVLIHTMMKIAPKNDRHPHLNDIFTTII